MFEPGWARGEPVPSDLYKYRSAKHARVSLSLETADAKPFDLGEDSASAGKFFDKADGYLTVSRKWSEPMTLELNIEMPIRRVVCNEKVAANRGRVALERGPLVYCLEAALGDRLARVAGNGGDSTRREPRRQKPPADGSSR